MKHIVRRFNLFCKKTNELLCVGVNYRNNIVCFVGERIITHQLEYFDEYLKCCDGYIEWFDE
jgi:hypothetical protein